MKRCVALAVALAFLATALPPGSDASGNDPDQGWVRGRQIARVDLSRVEEETGGSLSRSSPAERRKGGERPAVEGLGKAMPLEPPTWYRSLRKLLFGGTIGNLVLNGRFRARFGLLELIAVSGLILLAFRALSRYEPASVGQYAGGMGYGGAVPAVADPGPPASEAGVPMTLERGVESIRRTDPGFDPASFAGTVDSCFRTVQAAWTARDMARAADVLSVEVREGLQKECDRLRSQGRINRVEKIDIRRAAITGARQSHGWDHVTVDIQALLVDYTTNESGLNVVAGNPFEPVPFHERWEFVRRSGPHPWRVGAIR
jgi:predicted lipid-binding transport protein (Tim44 family)